MRSWQAQETGAGQHDIMSWEVMGPALMHLNKVNEKAILLDKTLKSWIYGMDEAQREKLCGHIVRHIG